MQKLYFCVSSLTQLRPYCQELVGLFQPFDWFEHDGFPTDVHRRLPTEEDLSLMVSLVPLVRAVDLQVIIIGETPESKVDTLKGTLRDDKARVKLSGEDLGYRCRSRLNFSKKKTTTTKNKKQKKNKKKQQKQVTVHCTRQDSCIKRKFSKLEKNCVS